MTMWNNILFDFIVFSASLFSTVIGFGAATISVPFASLVVDIKEAIAVLTVAFFFLLAGKSWFFRGGIDFKLSRRVIVTAIPGSIAGAYLLTIVDTMLLKRFLGALVLAYVILSFFNLMGRIKVGRKRVYVFGFFYGLLSGLIGSGELIQAPFLLSIGFAKEGFIGTFALIALSQVPFKLIVYARAGILSVGQIPLMLQLTVAAVAGLLAGKELVHKVSPELFRRIVLVTLAIVSIKLLFGS